MLTPEDLLTGVRWKIMQALASGPLNAVQIAKKANTTLPSISQSMHLLEAHGYVSSKALKRKTPGKPSRIYSLNKEQCNMTLCGSSVAQKVSFKPTSWQMVLLRTFLVPLEDQIWLQKLLCTHEHIFDNSAIAYVRSEKEETHILVITENVDAFRKQYAHILLSSNGDKRKIVSWSHTQIEAKEGLAKNEKYFVDLFTNALVIADDNGIIAQLQAGK